MATALPDSPQLEFAGLWAGLGDSIDQACRERQLPDPFVALGTADQNRANSAMYLRALRSRLESLAYLGREADPPDQRESLTPALSAAIRRFQADVGFVGSQVDGWVGPQTQLRLQQLVSFESEQDIELWGALAEEPQRWPAVRRAVYLRLYALGFLPWERPLRDDTDCSLGNADLRSAWQQFLQVARDLGLLQAPAGEGMATPALAVLFAHDRLVAALAASESFCANPANARFVQALGQIELWLLGHDVPIGPPPAKRREQRGTHGPRDAPHVVDVDPLALALDHFWAQAGTPPGQAHAGFSAAFFQAALAAAQTPDFNDEDSELQSQLLATVKDEAQGLVDTLKSIASGLWDGLRRAWGWLKRALAKAWENTGAALWNLARILASRARDSFETVVAAIEIVHQECVAWVGRVDPVSEADVLLLSFAADADATLLLDPSARAAALEPRIQGLARRHRRLGAACKVLGLVVGALFSVVRALGAAAVGAWLPLLVALSRCWRQLEAFDPALLAEVQGNEALAACAPVSSLYGNRVR